MNFKHIAGGGLLALASGIGARALAAPTTVAPLSVTSPIDIESVNTPTPTAVVTREEIARTVNAATAAETLKYLPDLFVRERHIGDTQAPIATRTSGVGSSARSLVYADDVLISALIGNNNTTASPRWGFVSPQEIERIDVLYGPFSAAYPGNSIGEVVNIVTRMPAHLEAGLDLVGSWQRFSQYGSRGDFDAGQLSGYVGDRLGRTSFWLSADTLDTWGQPLAFVSVAAPGVAGAVPVTGAIPTLNRTGAPVEMAGAGGLEHQIETNAKLKVAFDLTPDVRATYAIGLFVNRDRADAQTYLHDAAGSPIYAGQVEIGGQAYAVPASAFSTNVYDYDELHLGQSLKIASHSGGSFDGEIVASRYDYASDRQRVPTGALPAAMAGGPGTIVDMGGTGWETLDLKGVWRTSPHEISFGVHGDAFVLSSQTFGAADWIGGPEGAGVSAAKGRTRTLALWGQDAWSFAPRLTLTLGARLEDWRAAKGLNASASPALAVIQPTLKADKVSPKGVLAWTPGSGWRLTAAYGEAYRFPTVEELYQTVTVGPVLAVPNPRLKPEHARSVDLSAERRWAGGNLRVSAFGEWIEDALLSQTAPVSPASPALARFVQNVERTRVLGAEIVARQDDALIEGLDLSGSLTYADPVVEADRASPAAVGKQLVQVPRWRATAVASYQATPRLTLTAAARYSSRVFGAIDDSDIVAHTFGGFDPYLVVDLRATYRLTAHVTAALGVNNAGDDRYFLYHPFPQRTLFGELKWTL
ncbi:MAG: TonB-dependent receptor [Caulobacteraceae bacterium]